MPEAGPFAIRVALAVIPGYQAFVPLLVSGGGVPPARVESWETQGITPGHCGKLVASILTVLPPWKAHTWGPAAGFGLQPQQGQR